MEENIAEEIIEDVEDIFHPRPGGMIDRHRQEKARREAAQHEAENAAEQVDENAAFAVKVTQLSPEITTTNSLNVPAGGSTQILPLSKYRYRATVIASAAVTLAENPGKALGGQGFPLPAATPFVINSRAQLYAAATGAAIVSVIVENYAPESK